MKREEILEYLTENTSLEFSFTYDPYGESDIECSNNQIKPFLLDAMFEYIMSTGDPIEGDFIVTKENEYIIITSEDTVSVNWDHARIEEVAIQKGSIEEIELLLKNTFANNIDDDLCFDLYVTKDSSGCNMNAELLTSGKPKKINNEEFPEEIVSYIIDSIGGFNEGSENHGYVFHLYKCDDEISGEFTEYISISFSA